MRAPLSLAPADLRTIVLATAAAAVIAGAVTWMTGAETAAVSLPAAARPGPDARLASSSFEKTRDQVDTLAGLRSDPSLHLDTSSAWLPAGGIGILKATSMPNERVVALPMPAPVAAARNVPQTENAEDVPLPRAHPASVATMPVRPKNRAAAAPDAVAPAEPKSGSFFGMIERFFTPQDRKAAAAVLASNPRTAIYDISAHVVYMPNGDTLEAHSGLGQWLDDPTSFTRKDRGVTPPATYKISMREKLFHGVQALRLTPVGEAQMYGRDGMLAHTYMLGPNGQSNGCVSFKDYEKFLEAYNSGAIEQLIVVPKVTSPTAYAQAGSSS
ncbi:MAG: DUF2778 domain-containing protein [Pseudolabrys sp.]